VKVTAGTQLVENTWNVVKHHVIPLECSANMSVLEDPSSPSYVSVTQGFSMGVEAERLTLSVEHLALLDALQPGDLDGVVEFSVRPAVTWAASFCCRLPGKKSSAPLMLEM